MLPRDDGDGAVGAATITALRDLHIGIVLRCRDASVAAERIIVVGLA